MYNLINDLDVEAFLKELSQNNEVVEGVLKLSLKRALKKEIAGMEEVKNFPFDAPAWLTQDKFLKNGPFYRFDAKAARRNTAYMEKVDHVIDWVRAAVTNNAPWIQKRDEKGQITRLENFGTLDLLFAIANKDMKKDTQRRWSKNRDLMTQNASEEQKSGAIEGIWTNKGDRRWVRLKTEDALIREGNLMGHCIGDGGYAKRLSDPEYAYYSLRDAHNAPHVTIEVQKGKVLQCQGRQNKPPIKIYIPDVQKFIIKQGLDVRTVSLSHHGLIMGREKSDAPYKFYNVYNLPDYFEAEKDFDTTDLDLDSLPRTIKVNGEFCSDGEQRLFLPENLEADTINLKNKKNVKIGKGIKCRDFFGHNMAGIKIIGGSFYTLSFSESSNVEISEQAEIQNLDLSSVERVSISEKLRPTTLCLYNVRNLQMFGETDGAVRFEENPKAALQKSVIGKNFKCEKLLVYLNDGVEIEGGEFLSVRLSSCSNVRISPKTKVESLCLEDTNWAILPEELNLTTLKLIRATNVQMPTKLCVVRLEMEEVSSIQMPAELDVKEAPNLCNADIKEVASEKLIMRGPLSLERSNIKLPDYVKAQSLFLSRWKQRTLPKHLVVSDVLDISESEARKIEDGSKLGRETLMKCTHPDFVLGENIEFGGNVMLDKYILELPQRTTVGGTLYMNGAPIYIIPAGVECERIELGPNLTLSSRDKSGCRYIYNPKAECSDSYVPKSIEEAKEGPSRTPLKAYNDQTRRDYAYVISGCEPG